MYLKKVKIDNIRSIKDFEITFDKPAGWHVLIGDNGSGKTTILRAIAVGMIGHEEVLRLDPDWDSWLKKGEKEADIYLEAEIDVLDSFELPDEIFTSDKNPFKDIGKKNIPIMDIGHILSKKEIRHLKITSEENETKLISINDSTYMGLGVGFGPFRRFLGGSQALERLHSTSKSVGNYVTLFKEDAALSESLIWIKDLYLQSLEGDKDAERTIEGIKKTISLNDFLPNNFIIKEINSKGIFFKGNDGSIVNLTDLSEGIKSILSLTLELLRVLCKNCGLRNTFGRILQDDDHKKNILSFERDSMIESELLNLFRVITERVEIPIEGVVLIDEIDAHLHPTWQTKIGEWFTKIFPRIQFIVTTHSPLICRAAENGSIWRLPTLGTDEKVEQIIGDKKDRLIYGNVLDAYGTEAFGREAVRSQQSNEKLHRLGELNMLSALGKISKKEEKERLELQTILSTDAPTGF